jgi:hypothetical protein
MSLGFRKIVPVTVNDEWAEGPALAVIELDEKQIKRIRLLAATVKKLKAYCIQDWDYPSALKNSDYEDPETLSDKTDDTVIVTDKTTPDEAALLINDDNPFIAIKAKHVLAGNKANGPEAFAELCEKLTDWDGSMECERIKVSNDDFHYIGYIKHSNVSWETDGIPLKDLPRPKPKTKR